MEICQEDGGGDNPYWLILCKVPKDQRVRFMECIDLLPGVMENAGMKGYVNYCQRYISGFMQYIEEKNAAEKVSAR